MNIAVFASTRGTGLQAVLDALHDRTLADTSLAFVLSNKKNCGALMRAQSAGVQAYFIPAVRPDGTKKGREEYDRECLEICHRHGIDVIFLIGYMRLLSRPFVAAYRNRILNVHPSLLPSFPGMDLDVHRAVLAYGCKVSGCTVHLVDEGTDTGPIVIQRCVAITEGETPESLKEKVQAEEKKAIVDAIRLFEEGRIRVEGRQVMVEPNVPARQDSAGEG